MISTILTVYKNKKSFLWLPVIAVLLVSVLAFNAKVFSTIDVKMNIIFNGDTWETHKEDFNRPWFSKDKDYISFIVDLSAHHKESFQERPFTVSGEGVIYNDIEKDGALQGVYEVKVPVTTDQTYAITAYINEGNSWGLDRGSPKTFYVERDTVNPGVSISGAEEGALYNENINLIIAVDDKNFSPTQTQVSVKNNDIEYDTKVTWNGNTGHLSVKDEGEYKVFVQTADLAGNVAEEEISFFISRKGAALKVQDANSNDLEYDHYYKIDHLQIKVENKIPLDSVTMVVTKLSNDGQEQDIPVVESPFQNHDREVTGTIEGLEDGYYAVKVTMKEKHSLGAVYTLPTFNFTVDNTLPITSIIGVENNGEYESEKEVVFRVSDSNIDLNKTSVIISKDDQKAWRSLSFTEDDQGAYTSFKFNEDGVYTLDFNSVDKALNNSPNKNIQFTIDTSDPSISYYGMDEEEKYYNEQLDVTFKVKDVLLDLEKTHLKVTKDGVTTTKEFSRDSNPFSYGAKADYSFIEDGIYNISVASTDHFGRTDTLSKTIVLDQVKPHLKIDTEIKNKDKYPTAQKIDAILVSDTNLNLETTSLVVKKDGEEKFLNLNKISDTKASIYDIEFKEDGEYEVRLATTDKARNSAEDNIQFTVDQNAPDISINGVREGFHYPEDKRVSISIRDLTMKLNNTQIDVKKDNAEYLSYWELIKNTGKESIFEHLFTDEGVYEISVRSTDELGNERKNKLTFTIDKTKPEVKILGEIEMNDFVREGKEVIVKVNERHFTENHVSIEAKRTDKNGNTENYKVSEWINKAEITELSHTFKEEGFYQISVNSKDKAGNEAEKRELQFTVDNTAPVITIENVQDKQYYQTDKIVTIDVTESHYNNNNVLLNVTKNGKPYSIGKWENTNVRSSLSYHFKEDGEYVISMTSVDAAGNKADPKVTSFTIDKTAPVLSVKGVKDGEDYNRDMPVEVKLLDTNLDLSTTNLVITKNGKAYNAGNFNVSGGVATLNHIFKEEGQYKISFSATDKAKNKTVHEDISFIVDKTRPVVKLDGAEDNSFNPGNKTVTLTIDELNYSTNDVELTVTKDGRGYNMGAWRNTGKLSKLSHNFTQDGLYTISVTAIDKAGNGPVTQKLTFTVDKVNPDISIEGADNDAHYNVDKKIQVTINDLNLDINNVAVTKNGRSYSVGGFTENGNVASLVHTFSQEGDYRIQVNAKDKAGNSFSKELAFTIDKTAPVITPKVKGDGKTIKNGEFINSIFTPDFALDVAEDSIVSMTLNNQSIASNRAPIASKDMKYNYRVVARDKAGNETVLEISFTLDTTKPLLEITGIIEGFFNENMVPVIKYADIHLDESRSYIQLDGKPFTSGTTLTEEKDYVLEVVVTDLANNVSKRTIHFTIDKTEPAISFMDPISDKYFTDEVIPEFLIDSLSPYDIIALTLNGNPYEIGDPITEEGKHVLYFEIKDKAGNIKQLSVEFMIDKTPPKVLVDGVKEKGIYYDPVTVSLQLENPSDKILTVMINGELFEGDVLEIDGNKVIRSTFSDIKPYEIIVEAVDEAGNIERFVLPFEIADKSMLVKVYENKPLFFGGIAAGLIGAASAAAYAIRRRKQNVDGPRVSGVEE